MRRIALTAAIAVCLVLSTAARQAPALERHDFVIRDFRTESGVVLPEARVVYTTLGTLNAAGDNAVLLPSHYKANFNGNNWLIGANDRAQVRHLQLVDEQAVNGVDVVTNRRDRKPRAMERLGRIAWRR